MTAPRFKARASLPELPKGAERELLAQFRAIEHELARVQVVERNSTPVLNTPAYMAKPGELVLIEGNATGTLVTIPPGSPENIEQTIRVALVGGVLTPGVTISIVGRKGTIDGAQTVTITSRLLLELTSVGARGWAATCCGGGGGGLTPPVALTDLANIADQRWLGNVSGAPAPPAALTQAQIRTFIALFGAANTGLVPASGGGTVNFLRADGTFAPPTASVAMTDATITLPYANKQSDTANVVDANILAGSRVGIFWGTVLAADANDPELDDVTFTCTPAAGSMAVRVSAADPLSRVGGPYKIRYLIG